MDATIVPYLMAAIGSLAAAVGYQYMLFRTDHIAAIQRWEKCEAEKEKMWHVIADIKDTTPTQLKHDYGVADER